MASFDNLANGLLRKVDPENPQWRPDVCCELQYDDFGNVVVPMDCPRTILWLSPRLIEEGATRLQDRDGFARWAPPKSWRGIRTRNLTRSKTQ